MKVINLAKIFKTIIKSKSKIIIKKNDSRFQNKKFKVFESIYLNINSQKAFKKLGWKPKLSISKAAFLTIEWYNAFLKKKNLFHITKKQIQDYLSIN
jgi:HKD family nuclease